MAVIDTDEIKTAEVSDGTSPKETEEGLDLESQPADGSVDDGGGEAGADGEGAERNEDPTGEKVQGAESPFDLEAFKTSIIEAVKANQPAPEPKPITDQEWADIESKSGLPRNAVQYFGNMMMKLRESIVSDLGGRLSTFERDSAIQKLGSEPGFNDAPALRSGIEQFFKDLGIPATAQNDPKLLRAAVVFARGLNRQKDLKRARSEKEVNRRITTTGTPGTGSNGTAAKRPAALNSMQRDIIAKTGVSAADYEKAKKMRVIE